MNKTQLDKTLGTIKNYVDTGLSGKANSSHTHEYIMRKDTRNANETPNEMQEGLSIHLKSSGKDGLSDGGSYHPSIHIKPWNDYSGGPYGQLSLTQNQNMYFRTSKNGDEWNSWKKVSIDGHTHSYAGSSSAGGAATSANKLNTNAGGTMQPVYFTNGVPTALKAFKNNTSKGSLGWTSTDNDNMAITSNTLAFWDGAYIDTASNLAYCKHGAFGTVVTMASGDYLRSNAANSNDLRLASGDGRGVRFWDSDAYKIYMSGSTNETFGGRMTGETTSDYNIYFKIAGAGTNRGFVWKGNSGNVMGVDDGGNLRIKGSTTIGNNKVEMKYNSTSESLDFIFK